MEGNAEEIQKQIEGRINELPTDIQNAIFAVDFNDKIQAIGNAASLHLDQIQELGDNTMLVMLGFMTEQEFKNELRQLLQSNPEAVQKIESEINSQIFLSIRDSMKKFAEGQAAPGQAPQTPPALPRMPAVAPTPLPVVQTMPAPAPKVDMHPADVMLTEKTVTPPASPQATQGTAPKPQDYKADPYREPTN